MKKYSNSQLRWLAENLNASEMAYLMEEETPLQQANRNAGLADQPTSPGMVSQSQGSMKPQAVPAGKTEQAPQPQQQPQSKDERSQISTVCKAIKAGKLNKIEPEQLRTFLESAGISIRSVAQAVKFAIDFLAAQMKNPKQIQMEVLRNTTSGVNNCMLFLTSARNKVNESVVSEARSLGVDVRTLGSYIQGGNSIEVMRAGKLMSSLNESSATTNSISENVAEFYRLTSELKSLRMLAESKGVRLERYNMVRNMAREADFRINEGMSAVKYAIGFYNKNR